MDQTLLNSTIWVSTLHENQKHTTLYLRVLLHHNSNYFSNCAKNGNESKCRIEMKVMMVVKVSAEFKQD